MQLGWYRLGLTDVYSMMWVMFALQYVTRYVVGFLVVIAISFVLQTRVTYGIDLPQTRRIRIVGREVLWFGLLVGLAIMYPRSLMRRYRQWKWLLYALLLLIFWGVGHSLRVGGTFYQLMIGLKYDIYPFVLLTSATWLGYRFFDQETRTKKEKEGSRTQKKEKEGGQGLIRSIHSAVFQILFRVLVVGGLWQGLKLVLPEIFIQYLGYGPLGDFAPEMAPPVYYLTGSDGHPRLSGLFAGPNVLGFLLVAFASYRAAAVRFFHRRRQVVLFTILYVVSLFATLSRGAVVAFGIQMIAGIILLWHISRVRKILFSVFVGLVLRHFVGLIQQRKIGSTQIHENAWSTARSVIQDNPWGYGLGMSGPAQHYAPDYQIRPQHDLSMVESIYIQRVVNMGWLGLFLVGVFVIVRYRYIRRLQNDPTGSRRTKQEMESNDGLLSLLVLLMSLGFGGLLIEGLVLHVFIDSMVNYLFFLPYGVTVGYMSISHKQ